MRHDDTYLRNCTVVKVCEVLFPSSIDKPYLHIIDHVIDDFGFIDSINYSHSYFFVNIKMSVFVQFLQPTDHQPRFETQYL